MHEDPSCAKAILDSLKLKKLGKVKTKEPLMPLQETTAEEVKLTKQKTETGIKILTSNKLLTRPPVLLAHVKARKQFIQIEK